MSNHHGSTPAAWTTVIFVISGFAIGGAALVAGEMGWFYAGGGVVVLGVILGKVLQLMGLGQRSREQL